MIAKSKRQREGQIWSWYLNEPTAICPSPKKLKVELKGEDETILLEELKKKEEYEQVSVKVKVLEVMEYPQVKKFKMLLWQT